MNQSNSHTSSNARDFASAPQYIPNTGMYMGHPPWPYGAYVPHPGYTPHPIYNLYGVPPNMVHGAAPTYAPTAPLPDVGAGVAHHAFQAGPNVYYHFPVANGSRTTYISPYAPLTAAGPHPQHPFAPPLYHQPIPSSYFAGAVRRAHQSNPPPISHHSHFHQHHGAERATCSSSSFVPQAPSLSAHQKRVAEDLEDNAIKRIKMGSDDYTQRDACKRDTSVGLPPVHPASSQGSESSASASLTGVPTATFTYTFPPTATSMSRSSSPETTSTEVAEDAEEPDFEIEISEIVDAVVHPSESPTEAADDPGLCKFPIVWEVPKDLSIDNFCVPSKELPVIVPGVVATRVHPPRDGFPVQIFDPKDIAYLSSPTARLNDGCINGCAALLYSQLKLPTVDCAILSTYDLPRIRDKLPDERIWRTTSWTSYWEKNVWILPIHRPSDVGHWVICIIYFQTKELHLFDSFADQQPWKSDIKDIMRLIERFLTVARQRHSGVQIDLEGWQARALNINPCQTNGYDCGVWILAVVIAVLRGRHVTGLQEEQMSTLRRYLRSLVLSIPPV